MSQCQNQACPNQATKTIKQAYPARQVPPTMPPAAGAPMVLVPVELCDDCTRLVTTPVVNPPATP